MRVPEIGEIITNKLAIELCDYYGFDEIARRIREQPERYRDWEFDGGSMIPDEFMAEWLNIPEESLVEAFLLHDIPYAFGESNDKKGKHIADCTLELRLLNIGAPSEVAKKVRAAIEIFGSFPGTSFHWGFAVA